MLATPTGSPWSTLLSAPPVYQAKFAGLLRRSAPTPCSSISSRKLLSLVSLLIYVPPISKAFQLVSSSFSLLELAPIGEYRMCQRAVRRPCNPCERCLVRKVARLLAQPLSLALLAGCAIRGGSILPRIALGRQLVRAGI